MATLAIMIRGAVLNAATLLAVTISQNLYQGTVAKLHWMKKSGMTKPLKNIKRIMLNTKSIAQNYLTGLQHKTKK